MNQGLSRKWSKVNPTSLRIASTGGKVAEVQLRARRRGFRGRLRAAPPSRAPPCCRNSGRAAACWRRRARRCGRRGRRRARIRRTPRAPRRECRCLVSVRIARTRAAASTGRFCLCAGAISGEPSLSTNAISSSGVACGQLEHRRRATALRQTGRSPLPTLTGIAPIVTILLLNGKVPAPFRRRRPSGECDMATPPPRHHHARRHRAHGDEPASRSLDPGDSRRRRRRARKRRPGHARSDPRRPQRRQARGACRSAHGVERWTTDLDAALADPDGRDLLRRRHDADAPGRGPPARIAAGKHVYCEKPTRDRPCRRARTSRELAEETRRQERRRHGQAVPARSPEADDAAEVRLLRPHARGAGRVRLLGLRGRPAAGPAAVVELPRRGGRRHHPRHALPLALRARPLFGAVESVSCLGATHIPERWDEDGKPYKATAEDAAFATFMLDGRRRSRTINSSWVTRVYRDDLVIFQVDGTHGSAVAGLQSLQGPAARGDAAPGVEPGREADATISAPTGRRCPIREPYPNGFRSQWEMFIRHVVEDAPWLYTLREGAKGLQLVEAAQKSWRERRWVDVPALAGGERIAARRPSVPSTPQPWKPPTRSLPRRTAQRRLSHRRAEPLSGEAAGAVQPRRLCRVACRRRSARGRRSVADRGDRLGRDHRLSPASLEPWLLRRRSDGHRAARHGSRLAERAGADPPLRQRRRRPTATAASPAAPAPTISTRRRQSPSTTSSAPTRSRSRRSKPPARPSS